MKYARFVVGAFDVGLETNIIEGYQFLVDNYQDADQVYVFATPQEARWAWCATAAWTRGCAALD